MNREEWNRSRHHLRKLLRDFKEDGGVTHRKVEYKFAVEYNQMFDYFHLWNGASRNTIATFKIGDRIVVRYRPNSYYLSDILKFRVPGKKVIFVPSNNLSNHRSWVRDRVQRRVTEAMQEVNNRFLEPNGVSVIYTFPRAQYGIQMPTSRRYQQIRVQFESQDQQVSNDEMVRDILDRITSMGLIHEPRASFTYNDVLKLWSEINSRGIDTLRPSTRPSIQFNEWLITNRNLERQYITPEQAMEAYQMVQEVNARHVGDMA